MLVSDMYCNIVSLVYSRPPQPNACVVALSPSNVSRALPNRACPRWFTRIKWNGMVVTMLRRIRCRESCKLQQAAGLYWRLLYFGPGQSSSLLSHNPPVSYKCPESRYMVHAVVLWPVDISTCEGTCYGWTHPLTCVAGVIPSSSEVWDHTHCWV